MAQDTEPTFDAVDFRRRIRAQRGDNVRFDAEAWIRELRASSKMLTFATTGLRTDDLASSLLSGVPPITEPQLARSWGEHTITGRLSHTSGPPIRNVPLR